MNRKLGSEESEGQLRGFPNGTSSECQSAMPSIGSVSHPGRSPGHHPQLLWYRLLETGARFDQASVQCIEINADRESDTNQVRQLRGATLVVSLSDCDLFGIRTHSRVIKWMRFEPDAALDSATIEAQVQLGKQPSPTPLDANVARYAAFGSFTEALIISCQQLPYTATYRFSSNPVTKPTCLYGDVWVFSAVGSQINWLIRRRTGSFGRIA